MVLAALVEAGAMMVLFLELDDVWWSLRYRTDGMLLSGVADGIGMVGVEMDRGSGRFGVGFEMSTSQMRRLEACGVRLAGVSERLSSGWLRDADADVWWGRHFCLLDEWVETVSRSLGVFQIAACFELRYAESMWSMDVRLCEGGRGVVKHCFCCVRCEQCVLCGIAEKCCVDCCGMHVRSGFELGLDE